MEGVTASSLAVSPDLHAAFIQCAIPAKVRHAMRLHCAKKTHYPPGNHHASHF